MKSKALLGLFGLLLLHALAFRLWGQQIRWVISPVVTVTEAGGEAVNYRAPKAATIIDPSTGRFYKHSSAIDTPDWAVSLVYSADFSALDADAQVVNLLERDYTYIEDLLNKTPAELGFNAAKVNRIRQRLETRGVDTTGLDANTPLRVWLDRLIDVIQPGGHALNMGVNRGIPGSPPGSLVEDHFGEPTTDTVLSAHVPDTSGTGWTREQQINTTQDLYDYQATDKVVINVSATFCVLLYSSQPNPTGVEYDVQMSTPDASVGQTSTRGIFLVGRYADGSNFYHFQLLPDGHAQNDAQLFKKVTGTITQIAQVDTNPANNDVWKLEIRDAAKKVYKNGGEILSSADNVLTSAGKAGIACGGDSDGTGTQWMGSASHCYATHSFDNYFLTMVAAGGGPSNLSGGVKFSGGVKIQ